MRKQHFHRLSIFLNICMQRVNKDVDQTWSAHFAARVQVNPGILAKWPIQKSNVPYISEKGVTRKYHVNVGAFLR